MLCRAVLTTVVITCTFYRELIALPNPLDDQRKIQIKDLICVLWLNGLQKEDLDVNLLRKLQRHKLNIDDTNDDILRQECITRKTSEATNITENKNENEPSKATITTPNLNESINNLRNDNLFKMAQYFTNTDKLKHKYNNENGEKGINQIIKPKADNQNISYTINRKKNNENMLNPQYEATVTDKIILNNNNPNIENIIKFWNTIANKSKNNLTVKQSIEHTTKIAGLPVTQQIADVRTKQPKEADLISKLIAEYISKTRSTTALTTTNTPIIDLNNISEQLKYIIEKTHNSRLPDFKDESQYETTENLDNIQIKYGTDDVSISKSDTTLTPRHYSNSQDIEYFHNRPRLVNDKKTQGNHGPITVIEDILKLKEQLKLFSSITSIKNVFTQDTDVKFNCSKREFDTRTQIQSLNPTKFPQMELGVHDKFTKPQINILPKDLIQEIAEKVKEIVLIDLVKFTSTSQKPEYLTTEKLTTTANIEENKPHEVSQVIAKFLELFEQYKTIKEGEIVTANTKYKLTKKEQIKHEFRNPSPELIYPYLRLDHTKQIKKDTTFRVDQINSILNPKFSNLTPQELHYLNIPIINPTPIDRSGSTPLTIQTNLNEIPPLVLPISKPFELINQNIIVTTKEPYQTLINRPYWNSRLKIQRNVDADNFKYNKERSQYSTVKFNKRDRSIPYQEFKTTYNNNPIYDSQRYDHSQFDNNRHTYKIDNDDVNSNVNYKGTHNNLPMNYRPDYESNNNERFTRIHNGERFYEKLEKGDDLFSNYNDNKFKDGNGENFCTMKVASRQQLPLNGANKQSKYDDIHFKKFLKTQQKVNDMLERILATKTQSDGPRSVETPS